MARLTGYGIGFGALKRGGEGPLPIGAAVDPMPAYRRVEQVIDTTAAGDSFVGGFLAEYAQGHPIDRALLAGHEFAARVITHPGAIVPRQLWGAGPP